VKNRLILVCLIVTFALGNLAAAPQPAAFACVDEPKEKGFPRFARLMHDPQWMNWPSRMGDPALLFP
jgi:hypothetical protein